MYVMYVYVYVYNIYVCIYIYVYIYICTCVTTLRKTKQARKIVSVSKKLVFLYLKFCS